MCKIDKVSSASFLPPRTTDQNQPEYSKESEDTENFQDILTEEISKRTYEDITTQLEYSYSGARMMDDIEMMTRTARALAAFQAPVDVEIFTKKFQKRWLKDTLTE